MQGVKIVDKFEFNQAQIRFQDGVEIITARHTTLNEAFTLKKINIKEGSKIKYLTLINEVTILKEINSDQIVRCHKMLKTANNLYLVYDYISQNTLFNFLKEKSSLSPQIRQLIGQQLTHIMVELKKKHLLHLNLTPKNIEVIQSKNSYRHQKIKLKIINFQYGIYLGKPVDTAIIDNIPKTIYTAKEVIENRSLINFHSDVYSLGKILQELGLDKVTTENPFQNFPSLISDNCLERPDIEIIEKHFFKNQLSTTASKSSSNLKKKQQRKSKSPTIVQPHSDVTLNDKLKKTKNDDDNRSQTSTRKRTTSQSRVVSSIDAENNKTYCQRIIKKRNFAILMMRCCSTCLQVEFASPEISAIVSYLFLKKSTECISNLAKFLSVGHNDLDIGIPQHDIPRFFKTKDYHNLQILINRQMVSQKQFLNNALQQISRNVSGLIKIESFAAELRNEKINEQYFKRSISEYLLETCTHHNIMKLGMDVIGILAIISYIHDFASYEMMFQELINEEILDLDNQTLIIGVSKMEKEKVVKKILHTLQS